MLAHSSFPAPHIAEATFLGLGPKAAASPAGSEVSLKSHNGS